MSLLNVLKHLPGKHNQKLHAGSRGVPKVGWHVTGDATNIKASGFHIAAGDNGQFWGPGVYISLNEADTEFYAGKFGLRNPSNSMVSGDKVEVELDLKNPLIIDEKFIKGIKPVEFYDEEDFGGGIVAGKYSDYHDPIQRAWLKSVGVEEKWLNDYVTDWEEQGGTAAVFANMAQKLGYDSVIIRTGSSAQNDKRNLGGDQVVVFNPKQVKVKRVVKL